MTNIVIGIGGTGAKIVHAFTMMLAAGASGVRSARLMLIDQDFGNGNAELSKRLLQVYQTVAGQLRGEGHAGPALSSEIATLYGNEVWQPLQAQNQSLGSHFNYDGKVYQKRSMNSVLLELLYSDEERDTLLSEGFRGHPRVGAPIVTDSVDFKKAPWRQVASDIQAGLNNEGGVRIVICGSLFGGTGAAGVPTIVRVLQHHLDRESPNWRKDGKARIILNLAAPYFSIPPVPDDPGRSTQMRAKEELLIPTTRQALQYYHQRRFVEICHSIYLLGEEQRAVLGPHWDGGRKQTNTAHPLELFAACNIVDALSPDDDSGEKGQSFVLTRRRDAGSYAWSDLPIGSRNEVEARMKAFARFCFLVKCFAGDLRAYARDGKGPATQSRRWMPKYYPDYRTVLARPESNPVGFLDHLETFCEHYLLWFAQMRAAALAVGARTEWIDLTGIIQGAAEQGAESFHFKSPIQPEKLPQIAPHDGHLDLMTVHRAMVPSRIGHAGFVSDLLEICNTGLDNPQEDN